MNKEEVSNLSDDLFAYTITGRVTPESISKATGASVGEIILLQSESTSPDLKRAYGVVRAYMDDIMEES